MTNTGRKKPISGTVVSTVMFALLLSALVYRFWRSDEREIARHLSNLAEALSASGTDSEVAHLTRVAALREYFAPDVRVRFGGQEIASRDALMAFLARGVGPSGGLSVEFADQTVTVAEDGSTAQVALTAKMSTRNRQTGEATLDAREVAVTMAKVNNDWVITSAEPRETLERP